MTGSTARILLAGQYLFGPPIWISIWAICIQVRDIPTKGTQTDLILYGDQLTLLIMMVRQSGTAPAFSWHYGGFNGIWAIPVEWVLFSAPPASVFQDFRLPPLFPLGEPLLHRLAIEFCGTLQGDMSSLFAPAARALSETPLIISPA